MHAFHFVNVMFYHKNYVIGLSLRFFKKNAHRIIALDT